MKHLLFLSLAMLSLGAIAQNTTYVQAIEVPVHKVKTDNVSMVTIVADTVDFVMVTPDDELAGPSNPSDSGRAMANLIRIAQQQISFSEDAMMYVIELHLSSDKLDLYAADNSKIILKSNVGDTIRLRSFTAYATDIATISVQSFLKAENSIKLHYDDMAEIDHNGYSGGMDIIQNNSYHAAAVDHYATQSNKPDTKGKRRSGYDYYSPGDRSHLSFLWGWTNWGTTPLNGMLSVSGGSELKTKFTSYQIYASYAIVARRHCEMSVGLGYESDKYNFKNAFVQINEGDFVPSSSPGNWINDVKTRYINVPIQFTYFSHADHADAFGIGFAVVPGFGIAAKTEGYYVPDLSQLPNAHIAEQTMHINRYLNPVKCDVRLTLHFNGFSFFIQPSLIPVFNNGLVESDRELWKRELYPFKMGFSIGL